MKKIIQKEWWIKFGIGGLVLALFLLPFFFQKEDTLALEEEPSLEKKEVEEVASKEVQVDLKGAVVSPGRYILKTGSRVQDVIDMAGGLNENADTSLINLSKTLQDEMVIVIYTKTQVQEMNQKEVQYVEVEKEVVQYVEVEKECVCETLPTSACVEPDRNDVKVEPSKNDAKVEASKNDAKVESSKETSETEDEKESDRTNNSTIDSSSEKEQTVFTKVSLNKATLEELMTLPGIGEVKAKAILEYREEHGAFTSIDEILNVKGIGTSTFEKFKDDLIL